MHTQPHLPPLIELAPAHTFRRYPTNRHPSPDLIEAMATSIRAIGVLQHVLARPITDASTGAVHLQLIFGETRWRACQSIAADFPVPVLIQPMDDRAAARLHAAENFQRQDLSHIEQALEIQHLLDVGWEFENVMEQLGNRSKDWVYRRLSLLKLPAEGKAAVDSGNLSISTGAKIAALPEDIRAAAVKACVEPTHATRALPEREALDLIQKKFIEPLEQAAAWLEKRNFLENENPGCTWLDYPAARAAHQFQSSYEPAAETPSPHLLSDAARLGELIVPTWEQLASVHRAPIYIGLDAKNTTTLYVIPEPIIAAEIAAHDHKPQDCIFTHEAAVKSNRDHAERRKNEQAQQAAALHSQKLALARRLLTEDLPPTESATLATAAYQDACSYLDNLAELLDVASDTPIIELPLPPRPFDFLGRLHYAAAILDMPQTEFQSLL